MHIPYMDPMGFGALGNGFFPLEVWGETTCRGLRELRLGEAKEIRPDMCRELGNSKSLWKDFMI